MPARKKETEPKKNELIQVEVGWPRDDSLETVYVNQLAILHTGNEFYLTFGELIPPNVAIVGNDMPSRIDITPKVRLAINQLALEKMIEVLNNTMKEISSKKG